MEIFSKYISDFDICNPESTNYNNIVSIIPIFSQDWYSLIEIVTKLNKTYLQDRILDIFNNSNVSVHSRVKLIIESNSKVFSNSNDIVKKLIKYYITIEKYDENSGFYEKEITRNYIIKIYNITRFFIIFYN